MKAHHLRELMNVGDLFGLRVTISLLNRNKVGSKLNSAPSKKHLATVLKSESIAVLGAIGSPMSRGKSIMSNSVRKRT